MRTSGRIVKIARAPGAPENIFVSAMSKTERQEMETEIQLRENAAAGGCKTVERI
jgi:hypothetical protein